MGAEGEPEAANYRWPPGSNFVKKSIKIALCAAGAAKLAYLLFSPRVATRLYHSKLFSKDSDEGSEDLLANFREYENRQVLFAGGGGQQLRGWLFQHPTSNLVYLYCMGRASDIPKNSPRSLSCDTCVRSPIM